MYTDFSLDHLAASFNKIKHKIILIIEFNIFSNIVIT